MKSSSWMCSGKLRLKRYMNVCLVPDEILSGIESPLHRKRLPSERR